jgi:hypothetical protein
VEALGVAAAVEGAAGVLVDDVDLAVLDDVLVVAAVELLRADRVLEVVDERGVHALVEVLHAEELLDLRDALLGDGDGPLRLVDLVVLVLRQPRGDALREDRVPLRRLVGGTGDDERRAGLVDEDRVDLVDDRVGVAALHLVVGAEHHVVAEEVEAELVVRAVGDVRGVGGPLVRLRLLGVDEADLEAEEPVHPAHPLRVAGREVGVDRDDVDALARQGVEVDRHRRGEGLALTGLHLGDVTLVEDDPPEHLHVVGPLAEDPLRGLAHRRERLRQEVVEGLAGLQARAELVGAGAQRLVGEPGDGLLVRVDLDDALLELLEAAALAGVQDLLENHGAMPPGHGNRKGQCRPAADTTRAPPTAGPCARRCAT